MRTLCQNYVRGSIKSCLAHNHESRKNQSPEKPPVEECMENGHCLFLGQLVPSLKQPHVIFFFFQVSAALETRDLLSCRLGMDRIGWSATDGPGPKQISGLRLSGSSLIPSGKLGNFNAGELSAAPAHPETKWLQLLLNKTLTFINNHGINISRAHTA